MIIQIRPIDQVGAPRTKSGGVPQKYILDDRGRQLIYDLYDGTSERTDLIQKHMPHVPRSIIRMWACQMGKAHSRGPRWTSEEDKFLKRNLGKLQIQEIAKKLGKGITTVTDRAHKLGLYKKGREGYTLNDLVLGLGVADKTVRKWAEKGWLKGKKQTIAINRVVWNFTDKNIRDFIFAHPEQINPRKLTNEQWIWLVDILSGDVGIGELGGKKERSEEE
jgi:hypothetical protein